MAVTEITPRPEGAWPEVTAVIPTRNRWRLLLRAVASALRQEGVIVEVVVIDDGSTDETAGRLGRIADERLRVLRSARPGGVSRARNLAVDAARAPWVAFLDDDDVWAPAKLRAQLDRTADDVALVCCGAVFIDEDGAVLSERLPFLEDEEYRQALLRSNVVGMPSGVLARADLVTAVGGFDESLSISADWDLWIRLSACGRVVACRDALFGYTVHSAAMSAQGPEGITRDHERITAKYSSGPDRVEPDPVARARWVAGHQRESGRRVDAVRTYLSNGVRDRDPGNLLRGFALVFGERTLRAVRRAKQGKPRRPPWLDDVLRTDAFL